MLDLDFVTLRRIEEALVSITLDDLVAVLGQTKTDALLLVYNTQKRPPSPGGNHRAITLDALREEDLEAYDGLWAGFSALDVIRTDLATKGPSFYPLERIFLDLRRRSTLHHTWRNLARYLAVFRDNLDPIYTVRRRRVAIKILQLALPALLDERGAEDLIAIRPGPDWTDFVDQGCGTWLTVNDDLERLATSEDNDWIVALEQVRWFDQQMNPDKPQFVELRGILRQGGYDQALRQTCRRLARHCAELAPRRPELWDPAWALMTEVWLSGQDAEDLVAFFPHGDFEHFAQSGEGLRVYRVLTAESRNLSPGPRWALSDLSDRDIPAEFRQYGFSLVPLASLIGDITEEMRYADLGEILWRSGHGTALAQTWLLLARDGLDKAPVAVDLAPAILSDLARRAMMLISLSDPWHWRQGRHAQLVANAYQILQQAIMRQTRLAQEEMGDFYVALRQWYDCHEREGRTEIEDLLHQMALHLRAFLRATQQEDNLASVARHLVEVEEAIRYPLDIAGTGDDAYPRLDRRTLPSDLGRLQGRLAQRTTPAGWLSPLFEGAWGQLRRLRNTRYRVQAHERGVEAKQNKLEELLRDGRRLRRLVFAPPHETKVLHVLYDREIEDLNRQVRELRTEARLEIVPLNPWLDLQREVELAFEVRNTGRVIAQDVELVLARDPSFDLLERSPIREIPELRPGVPQRFSYRVRAVHQPDANLAFHYIFRGMEEQQTYSLRLQVRSLDEAPFVIKGDPYQFGRAIQKPADFYGRRDEMRKLLSSLYRGGHTNFLLRGPRRMGKTSMLYMLQHALLEPDVRRHFAIPEDWDEALERYCPVLLDLQAFEFQDDVTYLVHFFHTLLNAVCAALLPERCEEVLGIFGERRRSVGAPQAALEGLDAILDHRSQTRVVVLLDEYDEIYRPQGRALDTALRHVVQSEQRLTWIIASTQFLFKESKMYGSPWFNILDIVELDRLSDRAAHRLVEEPSRSERVAWQSDAVITLLDETGRHPAFLQLFCSQVMAYLNRERKNYVLPETIAVLAEQIVGERETVHSHFEFYWTDTPGVGRLILLAADESQRPLSRTVLRQAVQDRLQARFGSRPEARVSDPRGDLVPWWEQAFEDGMAWVADVVRALSYDRATRTYTFTVPLFRRWLQHKRRYEDLLEAALNKVDMEMERDALA